VKGLRPTTAALRGWPGRPVVPVIPVPEAVPGDRAAALYALCFAHPAVRAILWDGFWEGEGAAGSGLLRLDFSPRPAHRYLHKLINIVWHTRARGQTNRDGRFRFRGFFGDYRVAAQAGETATTALAACRATDGTAPFVLRLAVAS